MKKGIVCVVLVAMGLAVSLPAMAVITETQATWSYEGRALMSASGFTVYPPSNGKITESIVGGEVNQLLYDNSNSGAASEFYAQKSFTSSWGTDFTLDWKARVPVANPVPGGSGYTPLTLEARSLDSDGDKWDVQLSLGKRTDFTSKDYITVYYNNVEIGYYSVQVPGLDISQWNNYRIVGNNSGQFKVYINDIVNPVVSGNMAPYFGTQNCIWYYEELTFNGNPPWQYTGQTDFIRQMTNTGLYSAPGAVPEPCSLLALTGGLLCMARIRGHRKN